MSIWTTRSLDRERTYIVLRHTLKGVNYTINGIKFRNGYAVVEKDSKVYHTLKKIPILKKSTEFPLIHLRKLSFITRTSDVKTIFGQDVYIHYLRVLDQEVSKEIQEEKLEKEKIHVEVKNKCTFRKNDTALCKNDQLEGSPSGYCNVHILLDPQLKDLSIEIPPFMTKSQRKKMRSEVISKLRYISKSK